MTKQILFMTVAIISALAAPVIADAQSVTKEEAAEGIATILNLQGKLCARVISVEDRGTTKVITCQERRDDPTSRVRHVIEK